MKDETKYNVAISFPDHPLWLKGWKHRQPVWTEKRGEARTYTGRGAAWVCTRLKVLYGQQDAMDIPDWVTPERVLKNRRKYQRAAAKRKEEARMEAAKEKAVHTTETLEQIARLVHNGGWANMTQAEVLSAVCGLTLPWWKRGETLEESCKQITKARSAARR